MSVEKKDIIDYITEENGKNMLSISDHLQWGDLHHLYVLQEKNKHVSICHRDRSSIGLRSKRDKWLHNMLVFKV